MKRAAPLLFRLLLAASGCGLLPASVAHAYEDQLTLGAGLGYAHAFARGLPAHGLAVDVSGSIGLDDIWSVRAQLGYSYHPDSQPLSVFLVDADLIYAIDVLEWVPYFGGGIDGVGTLRSGVFGTDLGLHAAFGLDWLCSRKLAFELEARPVFLLTALDQSPVYLTLTLSALWFFEL